MIRKMLYNMSVRYIEKWFKMVPVTVSSGGDVVVVVVTANVAAVVGLMFPRLCPSLCQVSMGWWTEGEPYSVSCWTLSHWLSVVTVVPRSRSRCNVAAYQLIIQ
jgi:hypothetical protein